MGRYRNARTRTRKNKSYKRSIDTKRRPRDIDQIQDDIKKEIETGKPMTFEYDEDLPGAGKNYCITCARHFADEAAYATHITSRPHKRRLKDVAQKQYSQKEAEAAAGKTIEILPPAHGPKKEVQMTE